MLRNRWSRLLGGTVLATGLAVMVVAPSANASVAENGHKSCPSNRWVGISTVQSLGTVYHYYNKSDQLFTQNFSSYTHWTTASSNHSTKWSATASSYFDKSQSGALCLD